MGFNDALDRASREYGYGTSDTEWFKVAEGPNKIRVMTFLEPFGQHYKPGGYCGVCISKERGCPGCKEADNEPDEKKKNKVQVKFLCWVLDYKDDRLKLYKAPYAVFQQLQAMAEDPDFGFQDMPMPFDVTINAKGAGEKSVTYTLMPARSNSEIDPEILEKFKKLSTPEQIKEKMKNKKLEELSLVSSSTAYEDDTQTEEIEEIEEVPEMGDLPL